MPNRYLSHHYLSAIQQKISANLEPWTSAHKLLLTQADTALQQPPLSVRQNGGSPFFKQDAVYIPGKDGQRNPESNMKSGDMASALSSATYTLALAYRVTHQNQYADKALELIHAWCIDQNTLMFPTGNIHDAQTPGAAYGGDIIIFARMQDLFLACYLLNDYPHWNLPAQAAVKRWTRKMLEPHRNLMFYQGTEMYNNWDDARILYLAKGALFTGDLDLLLQTFDRFRQTLPMKMTDHGELHRETMRTRSMHYTLFALDSMIQLAEIAHHHNIDLYNYTVNHRNLKTAVNYATHHLLNMKDWPHPMLEPLTLETGHWGLFELTHRHWPSPQYLQILQTHAKRPIPHSTLLFATD